MRISLLPTLETVTASGAGVAGLARVTAEIRRASSIAADDLLTRLPDTGDHATGRAVDDFVEQAADALRALATLTAETSRLASGVGADEPASGPPSTHIGAVLDSSVLDPSAARPGWLR